jgi:hypothetical protein
MTTKTIKRDLLEEYLEQMAPLAPIAMKAFGSRATDSTTHDVSAKYTALLVEYTDKGGSLLMLAEALNVTYPALRRRVMTAKIAPLPRSTRTKRDDYAHILLAKDLQMVKLASPTQEYHDTLRRAYDDGFSLNKLAHFMGLKSAYPLYYGLNKSRMREEGIV